MHASNRYAEMRATARVRERTLFVSPRIPSELELQARWFAGDFGKHFVTTTGDKIDVVQFGTWNRESGPDFRDAATTYVTATDGSGDVGVGIGVVSWSLGADLTLGTASPPSSNYKNSDDVISWQ